MLLRDGEYEGTRYLTEESIREMGRRQTDASVSETHGLCAWVNETDGSFGHGGALSTQMTIDPARGLASVFLVQQESWREGDGEKVTQAWRDALAQYAEIADGEV